jgi:hypothetical protein
VFGFRCDGKKVKGVDGLTRMAPLFLGTRPESVNYFTLEFPTQKLDDYISAKKKQGHDITYRDLVIATLVRVFYVRPKLNWFIVNGVNYRRNFTDVSMMTYKSLRRIGEGETLAKARFIGTETIFEVSKGMNNAIDKATKDDVSIDGFTNIPLPTFLLKTLVGSIKLLDKYGLLTDKFLFNTSPFHCSIFLADLRSIKMDYIHHHLYRFGNCGFFCVLGRDKLIARVDEQTGEIKAEKVITLAISEDGRSGDGLYWSNVLRQIHRIVDDFSCLEIPPEEFEIHRVRSAGEVKREEKQKKKQQRRKEKCSDTDVMESEFVA